jgi:hypothetical protein
MNSLIDAQIPHRSPREQLVAALGDKSAIVVGAVAPDGTPWAARGWAVTIPEEDRPVIRVVVGTADVPFLAGPTDRPVLAVTVTHVHTLESVQFKGPSGPAEPATEEDLRAVEHYCDAFFDAVLEIDGVPRALMERLLPRTYATCVIEVEQTYDQTPGPKAGTEVGSRS